MITKYELLLVYKKFNEREGFFLTREAAEKRAKEKEAEGIKTLIIPCEVREEK